MACAETDKLHVGGGLSSFRTDVKPTRNQRYVYMHTDNMMLRLFILFIY